jgi:hypothetical protein
MAWYYQDVIKAYSDNAGKQPQRPHGGIPKALAVFSLMQLPHMR